MDPAEWIRLADQLAVDAGVLAAYGGWQDRTRRDHLRQVLARAGWRTAGTGELKNRRDGRMVYYRLDDAHVRMLLDLSREHLAHAGGEK